MFTSRVPAALDELLAILRDAPGLSEVKVMDGPASVNLTARQVIYIGWSPSSDTAVSLTQAFANAGARNRDEDFTISGHIESWSGDADAMKLQRDRAFAILGEVEIALRATDAFPEAPTLNNTVQWAHLTAGDLTQEKNADGPLASLGFSVTCRARI